MAYTRTDTPHDALYALADRVPLAVVTNGAHGALAIDAPPARRRTCPRCGCRPSTRPGPGDVFGAGIVVGTLAGWPLADRLAFAALCSALAVQQFGGSLAAPGWGDIARLVARGARAAASAAPTRARCAAATPSSTRSCPPLPVGAVRRAAATIARHADVEAIP